MGSLSDYSENKLLDLAFGGAAFAGFYFAKPAATAIGQMVYRYDDNSLRLTVNSVASFRWGQTGNRYGLRYEEALILEAALMRRELKRLRTA